MEFSNMERVGKLSFLDMIYGPKLKLLPYFSLFLYICSIVSISNKYSSLFRRQNGPSIPSPGKMLNLEGYLQYMHIFEAATFTYQKIK